MSFALHQPVRMEVVGSMVLQLRTQPLVAVRDRFSGPGLPEDTTPSAQLHLENSIESVAMDFTSTLADLGAKLISHDDSKPIVHKSTHAQDRKMHTEQFKHSFGNDCLSVKISKLELNFYRILGFNWCSRCQRFLTLR